MEHEKKSNPIIELTSQDIILIAKTAEEIGAFKRKHNERNKKHFKKVSDYEVHYVGLMGEFAAAKYFGVTVNTDTFRGGDGGSDLVIGGNPVQVKTTRKMDNQLLVFDSLDDYKTDIAMLASVRSPLRVELRGIVRRAYFVKHHSQPDLGYGTRYVLPARLMAHVDALKEILP